MITVTDQQNLPFQAGRQRYARLVTVYYYDSKHKETDGEPFGCVRIGIIRNQGERYDLWRVIANIECEFKKQNFMGFTELPSYARQIVPNIYMTVSPYVRKLLNFTVIARHRKQNTYIVHSLVYNTGIIPSRSEMYSHATQLFNSGLRPLIAEHYAIKHCLNDSWANVGTTVTPDYYYWLHLKEMEQTTVDTTRERGLDDVLDDGEPGDTYSRGRML